MIGIRRITGSRPDAAIFFADYQRLRCPVCVVSGRTCSITTNSLAGLSSDYETAALPAELRRRERCKHCIHWRRIQALFCSHFATRTDGAPPRHVKLCVRCLRRARHASHRAAATTAARNSRQFPGARCVQECYSARLGSVL